MMAFNLITNNNNNNMSFIDEFKKWKQEKSKSDIGLYRMTHEEAIKDQNVLMDFLNIDKKEIDKKTTTYESNLIKKTIEKNIKKYYS